MLNTQRKVVWKQPRSFFFEASSAIVGPYDDVILPKKSLKSDWEVELAVVIALKPLMLKR